MQKLLRVEMTEQLAIGSLALTALATDWRKLHFPEASDAQFADGYAQAGRFGILMDRAREIDRSVTAAQVSNRLADSSAARTP